MGYNQAYNAYKENNVKTASQGKLVVLLYEEAVRQLTQASGFFTNDNNIAVKNIEKYGKCLLKTQEIITELQVSLNMEQGGQIANNLMALYIFFNKQLTDANINRNKQIVDSVLQMMSELLESWKQAAIATANAPSSKVQQTLNIEG